MPDESPNKTMDNESQTGKVMLLSVDTAPAQALAANVVTHSQQLATLPPDHPAHSNWATVLKFLLMIAPAIASPFIKNPGSRQIFETESQIAGAVSENLPG